MVEHQLPKLGVEGSIPFARSILAETCSFVVFAADLPSRFHYAPASRPADKIATAAKAGVSGQKDGIKRGQDPSLVSRLIWGKF